MPTLSELTANPDLWHAMEDEHKRLQFFQLLTFYNNKTKGQQRPKIGREGAQREKILVAEKRERAAAAAKEQVFDAAPEDYNTDCCAGRVRLGNTIHFSQCSKMPGGAWANTHPECQMYCSRHAKEMVETLWLKHGDIRVVGPGSFGPHTNAKASVQKWAKNREIQHSDCFEDTRDEVEQENYPAPAKITGNPEPGVWGKHARDMRRVVVPEVVPEAVIHEEADLSDSEDEEDETDSEEEFEVIGPGGGIYEGVPLYVKKYLMGIADEMKKEGCKLDDDWKEKVMELVDDDEYDEAGVMEEIEWVGKMSYIISGPDDF